MTSKLICTDPGPEDHSSRISAASDVSTDLLTTELDAKSLYEIARDNYEIVMKPYRDAYRRSLEFIMKGWLHDVRRSLWIKPRKPFRPVRTTKARKRRQQRKGQVYVFINYKDVKWFEPIGTSTGRLSSSEPVRWELRKPKSDSPNEFDLVRTHQGKPIDE